MDYQFHLPQFTGPLDLLLYLVKRHEVDLLDIPIADLAKQYQEYVEVIQTIDMEASGEFLVMASTLLEMKSKMVLPVESSLEENDPVLDDPRRELVRQLMEYRKFKEASLALEVRAEQQATYLSRHPVPEPTSSGSPTPLRPVDLWDLVSAFGRLMRETLSNQDRQVVADETPQHVYMEIVRARVVEQGQLVFRDLFMPPYSRARLVGLFLAVLELMKQREIEAVQHFGFAEIYLCRYSLSKSGPPCVADPIARPARIEPASSPDSVDL